jgi:SAM-dependent methyltransferase
VPPSALRVTSWLPTKYSLNTLAQAYDFAMAYIQTNRHSNLIYRNQWINSRIQKSVTDFSISTVLDVGAGLSPYKQSFESLGVTYFSQDFDMYVPTIIDSPGLHDKKWDYPKHDFTCDVLDIPENVKYDFIICTEVFEHVPDPVALIKKLTMLTSSGGYLLITVPLHSLMHQSPYWFSSGLSPFWFEHWAKELELEICELEISGDYIDFMEQELMRLLTFSHYIKGLPRFSRSIRILRRLLPKSVLQSGGFGTMCVLRKT